MPKDFPPEIQSKLDDLTPRQFGTLGRHLDLPVRKTDDVDGRYHELLVSWRAVYPMTEEAFSYLDRLIVAVIQQKILPPLSLLQSAPPSKPAPLPAAAHQPTQGNAPVQISVQATLDLRDMPPAGVGFKVAFSFAGEQRDLVRSIAVACEVRLGRGTVFYDEWFEHVLGGYGADMFLQNIYGKQTQMIVLCVASHYADKPWTMAEHDAIMARIFALRNSKEPQDRLRFLPIRVGEGEVPGVLPTAITFDARAPGRSPEQIAEIIVRRLAELGA